jgi:hypothetical protein
MLVAALFVSRCYEPNLLCKWDSPCSIVMALNAKCHGAANTDHGTSPVGGVSRTWLVSAETWTHC